MKIKRFLAEDIRQAMRRVREELGPDAVILSNRSTTEGVEIVAARDFDEQALQDRMDQRSAGREAGKAERSKPLVLSSLRKRQLDGSLPARPSWENDGFIRERDDKPIVYRHRKMPENPSVKVARFSEKEASAKDVPLQGTAPLGALEELRDELKALKKTLNEKLSGAEHAAPSGCESRRGDLLRRLTKLGVFPKLAERIADEVGIGLDPEDSFEAALRALTGLQPLDSFDLLERGGIAALVGPTGVGKTTTIAKMAANYVLRHGADQVGLVTLDNYRIAAFEQLQTYGRILGVPTRIASSADQIEAVFREFSGKSLILVDTAGMSQRNMKRAEQIKGLQRCGGDVRSYLVMSASTEQGTMNEILEAFSVFKPAAAILTKFDEAAAKGSALSALIGNGLPLGYIADGQHVPEDLHRADAAKLIESCLAESGRENDYNDKDVFGGLERLIAEYA
ncbi:MAG: flagellar biosynthesis protein FlhF [Gammaproteobacteria bacterium]